MPSRTQDFVLLDAGANDVCEALHLAQFAVMETFTPKHCWHCQAARRHFEQRLRGNQRHRPHPRSRELCRELDLNFIGYVEGFDLFNDAVDVVVTDGFTGNIVLKPPRASATPSGAFLRRN